MDERILKLVMSRPIPDRLIETLSITPLVKPHDIGMWVRCGGRILNHPPRARYSRVVGPHLRAPTMTLNSRQRLALQMLADGVTVGMAAQRMGVARQSFTNTITEARWRLGAETVEQAMVIATAQKIIKAPDTRAAFVSRLNADERQVLEMFWQGAALEEIAHSVEIPLNTVKMRLRSARRKMEQTRTIDAAMVAFG